jgi:hypothetical protein
MVTTLATVSKIFVPLEAKCIIVIIINPINPMLSHKEMNKMNEELTISLIVKKIIVKLFKKVIRNIKIRWISHKHNLFIIRELSLLQKQFNRMGH